MFQDVQHSTEKMRMTRQDTHSRAPMRCSSSKEGRSLAGWLHKQIYQLCLISTRLYMCALNVFVFFIISLNKYIHSTLSIVSLPKWFRRESLWLKLGDVWPLMVRAQDSLLHPQMCRPSHSQEAVPGRVLQPADNYPVMSSTPLTRFPCQARSHH